MPRSGRAPDPALDHPEPSMPDFVGTPPGLRPVRLNDWPQPPWRCQVLAVLVTLFGLCVMMPAAPRGVALIDCSRTIQLSGTQ